MNSQETMSLVRQLLTFAFGILVTRGVLSADQAVSLVTNLAVIIPAAGAIGSIAWSVYAHWNMKKVPETAGIVLPPAAKALVLFAVVLGVLALAPRADAATPTTAAQINTDILQKLAADATAALADANANNDVIAAACYAAIGKIASAKLTTANTAGGGLLTGFQKVRDFTRLNASPQGTDLIVGCAPLVQDAKLNFVQFFTNIGGAVLLKGIIPLP